MAYWRIKSGITAIGLILSGCTEPVEPVPVPPTRPEVLVPAVVAPPPEPQGPSLKSRVLANHYGRLEGKLIAQGLMRTDGGGIDTSFNARNVQENFERIAFFDEYVRGQGLTASRGEASRLKRWEEPIRFSVEFGKHFTEAQADADRAEVERYVSRLARITGHPMSMDDENPNFHVLYMSEDDSETLPDRILEIVPNISRNSLGIFHDLPRTIHCLVVAFSATQGGHEYARAIALIRAEHPTLLRRSCVHEEIAQGLGLANDSPQARPSIFNDDDEFALLTNHDEILLEMLYNPSLRPGMSLEEAKPIVRELAQAAFEGDS